MARSLKKSRLPGAAIVAIAGIWLAYMATAALVIVTDPYDIYPWGVRTELPSQTGPLGAAKLIRMAAKDPSIDTVLIGTSPTSLYTPQDLRAAFPDSQRAWNASYLRASGEDRLAVLDQFIRYSKARHYIISLDYFLALPLDAGNPDFSLLPYDRDPTNDLRMVTIPTIRDTWSALRTGHPLHDGQKQQRDLEETFDRLAAVFRTPEHQATILASISAHRDTIDGPGKSRCADFPAFAPFLSRIRTLTQLGARVDVLIPVFSPAIYYDWRADRARNTLVGDNFLSDQLLLRRCVVVALDMTPRAAVWAPDRDGRSYRSFGNFVDASHLQGHDTLMRTLKSVGDERFRLTAGNIDSYVKTNGDAVKSFQMP